MIIRRGRVFDKLSGGEEYLELNFFFVQNFICSDSYRYIRTIMVAQWSITFRACELSCGHHPLYHIDIFSQLWWHNGQLRWQLVSSVVVLIPYIKSIQKNYGSTIANYVASEEFNPANLPPSKFMKYIKSCSETSPLYELMKFTKYTKSGGSPWVFRYIQRLKHK